MVPELDETVDTAAGLRAAIGPGDLRCFSGSYLHASVPNTAGVARFSVDVRTVDGRDFVGGRGASNVGGAAPRVATGWFRHAANGAPLGGQE